MYLDKEKRDKVYELLFSLLNFTNSKFGINKKIKKFKVNEATNPNDVIKIKEKLWSDNKIIDEYVAKNPDNLQERDLEIIKSWKNRKTDNFLYLKHLKKYDVLLDGSNNMYGIVGISNEISDIFPEDVLPLYINTTLLPFEDVIIYDTIICPFTINLGPGIKRLANEEYANRKNEIITNLNGNMSNKIVPLPTQKKHKYYQIKVSIRDTHPPVWRRLLIPEGITFHELNAIIQLAFDWCGYHLYSFEVGATLHEEGIFIELPNIDNWGFRETKNSKTIKIDRYFEEFKRMKFTYDFGDNWIHDILIEKIIEDDEKLKYPICTKAKMASLPEDCGGPWGYEELMDILSDKNNERYEDMKEWSIGMEEDRTKVDIEDINEKLKEYKGHAKLLLP